MKNLVLPVLVLLTLTTTLSSAKEIPVARPDAVGMSAAGLAKVDDAMNKLVEEKRLAGGIVMVARRGRIVHFESYGMMDIESKKPMRNDSIQRFYSMTKSIVSAAALVLVDDGKLDLDAAVANFIPEFRDLKVLKDGERSSAAREMTVRDLLRHTSGFTYGAFGDAEINKRYGRTNVMDRDADLAVMTKKLSTFPLVFDPGSDWHYGISTDVLGRVIEVAADTPLDEFLKQRIFGPLDMKDTGFFVPSSKQDRFAACYFSNGKGKLTLRDDPATSRYLKKPTLLSGGGGLVSTARDYMRFLMMVAGRGEFFGTRVLSTEAVRLMTTNQLPKQAGWVTFGDQIREGVGFGLGFSVRVKASDWDPNGRVGEYGWGGAASTHYWSSPKDDLIVITVEQTWPFSFMTELATKGLIYDAIVE